MGSAVARTQKVNVPMGTAALIGQTAVARTALAPDGYVLIKGERWRALVEDGAAEVGERVTIVGAEGLRLRVKKENSP